ncbi:Cytochrome b-c1 complex subunit 9 [Glycine soja]
MTMEAVSRRRGGGIFESLYKVVMRRNSVYVTFVIAGAFLGERFRLLLLLRDYRYWLQAVDYGVHKLWEANNVGKRYEDIPVLGQRQSE